MVWRPRRNCKEAKVWFWGENDREKRGGVSVEAQSIKNE